MIKLLIQLRKFSGGPYIFRKRISKALAKLPEIEVIHDRSDKFDVELCVVRHLTQHNKPKIIRVDGCYYIPKKMHMNKSLKKAIDRSKHTIFQSNFSKKMVRKILKRKPKSTVIYNGIDLDFINSIEPDPKIKPGSFVSVALWRENKRPKSLVKGFLKADTGRDLYIIGEGIRCKQNKRIHLLGNIKDPKKIFSIMKACQYQIHLCHIDSCPNSVVEGLACGLNVLCTNLGGTKELVRDNGIIMDVDKWDFKPSNFKRIDDINKNVVADNIHKLIKIKERVNRPDLDINIVAQKYLNVIKKVLGK